MKKEKTRPFSCGTDYGDWHEQNCCKCPKFKDDIDKTCKMEYELSLALVTDGLVKKSTLKKVNKLAENDLYGTKETKTKFLNCEQINSKPKKRRPKNSLDLFNFYKKKEKKC